MQNYNFRIRNQGHHAMHPHLLQSRSHSWIQLARRPCVRLSYGWRCNIASTDPALPQKYVGAHQRK